MNINRWNRIQIEQQETIVTLLCHSEFTSTAERALQRFRNQLENHIRKTPEFRTNHCPMCAPSDIDPKILKMYQAASRTGVGPMASVAGIFAETALECILNAGASEAIVDNGGDIALYVSSPVYIGIYTGTSVQNLAFYIPSTERPLGICTSSGTVGHSFSYGCADAAIVISENIALADAAATALGNRVKEKTDLQSCFQFLHELIEIQGAMVIRDDQIALYGSLPRLVEAEVDETLITRGQLIDTESVYA